jgi:hypothetical protein
MLDGVKERAMNVLIQVWSDNHDHDEIFGTKPNEPHYIYNQTLNVPDNTNLFAVIIASLKETILTQTPTEPIYVMWENSYSNLEEVRIRIANSEYLCRAVVTL